MRFRVAGICIDASIYAIALAKIVPPPLLTFGALPFAREIDSYKVFNLYKLCILRMLCILFVALV
ncbi:hypothetical protein D3C75_1379380 [compost metagenome]